MLITEETSCRIFFLFKAFKLHLCGDLPVCDNLLNAHTICSFPQPLSTSAVPFSFYDSIQIFSSGRSLEPMDHTALKMCWNMWHGRQKKDLYQPGPSPRRPELPWRSPCRTGVPSIAWLSTSEWVFVQSHCRNLLRAPKNSFHDSDEEHKWNRKTFAV